MSIHNTLFFKHPMNYIPGRVKRHGVPVIINTMTDNRYTTASRDTDIDINIADRLENPTSLTHIYLKYQGELDEYVATPTGSSGSAFTRTVPTEVTNFEGSTVSLEVNGFKHDLYELSSKITAESIRMQFTGTNLEIYALMLLENVYELEANAYFTQMDFRKMDRTGQVHPNSRGGVRRVQRVGVSRWKWEGSYNYTFGYGTVDAFTDMAERHVNHVFAQEFSRHPERVYLACFSFQPLSGGYFTPVKANGEQISFEILER